MRTDPAAPAGSKTQREVRAGLRRQDRDQAPGRVHIRTIGLFNAKAKSVIATCRPLVERHGGEVPPEREALERLPGVGRKTANVVLNTAFGVPVIAVDTHIFRAGQDR